jgi:hypothetical protein
MICLDFLWEHYLFSDLGSTLSMNNIIKIKLNEKFAHSD